jgi:hypothetical protein
MQQEILEIKEILERLTKEVSKLREDIVEMKGAERAERKRYERNEELSEEDREGVVNWYANETFGEVYRYMSIKDICSESGVEWRGMGWAKELAKYLEEFGIPRETGGAKRFKFKAID